MNGEEPRRPSMAWFPVTLVAVAVTVLLVATSGGYGYHRDELYFRLLGQTPAWGYVDQPPATPLLARLTVELFADELWALRLPAALMVGGTAVLTALLARELGGGWGAQILAAAGMVATFPLVFGHVLLTASGDLLLTAAVLLALVRALLRDPRWWLVVGVLVGVSLYNKHLVLLPLIAIAAGLLLVGPRRALASGWLWAAVATALVVGAPNVIYQISHGWPQLEMARAIERDKGAESRILLVPLQVALLGFALVPVWVAGAVRLFRVPVLRPVRALAVGYPVLLVLVFVTGGQPYYPIGLVLALYAAGCVPVCGWLSARPWRRWAGAAGYTVNAALSAVTALPLLPVAVLAQTPIADINQATSDQVGWPVYVEQISAVVRRTPAEQPAIITANYGEAGALDRYGTGLPPVHSGHNELWYRGGPAEGTDVIIAVGMSESDLVDHFSTCDQTRQLDNGVDIANEEQGLPVIVCREPIASWAALWPRFQHFS